MGACFNLPPTRIIPSIKIGFNVANLLRARTFDFGLCKVSTSS